MQTYHVKLQSPISDSFRAVRAANSLDINTADKSVHELRVTADLASPYNVGLIVGSSGSGKTTLARSIWGDFSQRLDPAKAVIDQFPEGMSYDDCAQALNGIGLTSVPCWIKPAGVLSNGQRARAEAALALHDMGRDAIVLDEWTSVVDRNVAKVMSHCVQKYARRVNRQTVLVACHYDIIDWLQPDWIIDCNSQTYTDRRSLPKVRSEQLQFEVREITSNAWKYFSKYHYLSSKLPGGKVYYYGLFRGDDQIGFLCFANYIPIRPGSVPIYHSNRVVIHPDFAGMGLGLRFVNACAQHFRAKTDAEIRATFSSEPMYRARLNDKNNWRLLKAERKIGYHKVPGAKYDFQRGKKNGNGFRENVKVFTFKYIGK